MTDRPGNRGTTVTTAGAALVALTTLATLTGTAAPVAAQAEAVRLSGERVAIWNLAGRVTVVPGTGSEVVVRVDRSGGDGARLALRTGEVDGRAALRVVYPSERVRYGAAESRSRTTVRVRDDGTFGRGGGGDPVHVTSSGGGLEAWADLRVEVPPGRDVAVYLAVGETDVRDVASDIRIDTGSGSVDVDGVQGRLRVDTGSGSVAARNVTGRVEIDTGSGSVVVRNVRGDRVVVDTGSGGVTGSGIDAGRVIVDTGSGAVELTGVTSADVGIDTGSGSVELEILGDVDRLAVDTGSGSVRAYLPASLGAEIEIETGSGGIDLDFPVEIRTMKRDQVEGRIGDGNGRITIDTGSGSVRLIRR